MNDQNNFEVPSLEDKEEQPIIVEYKAYEEKSKLKQCIEEETSSDDICKESFKMNMADLQSELIRKTGRNISQQSIASVLGTTRQNINARIKNYSELSREELEKIQCKFNVNLINYYDSNFIKQLRIDHALSREELANMLGVSIDAIIDIEMLKKPIDSYLQEVIHEVFGTLGNGINSNVPSDISITVPFCEKQDGNSLSINKSFISTCENTLARCDNSDVIRNLDTFNKRFNKLQKQNSLNDFQMSKETGITESRIEKLGIGKAQPTFEELNALKACFDISIDWLLYGNTPCRNAQNDDSILSADEINILKKMAQKFSV